MSKQSGDLIRPSCVSAIAVLAATLLMAPAIKAQETGGTAPAGPNLPSQPVGEGDLLSIAVYGAPELTRTVRVSDRGSIRLPMLSAPVDVLGLLPVAIEEKVAEALTKDELLVGPIVTVNIAEYATRPISVVGAVHHPLTFEVHEETTLLDALAQAEGLTPDAGSEILVTRRVDGEVPLTRSVRVRDLIEGADPDANLVLKGGEEVRVPEIGRVFVVGNVTKPGAFPVANTDGMTLMKALALAEGLAPFATKQAYIYRPSENGEQEEVEIELRKIMDRKLEDVTLLAGDILYVPDNRRGRMTASVLDKVVSFAAGTASGALILGLGRR